MKCRAAVVLVLVAALGTAVTDAQRGGGGGGGIGGRGGGGGGGLPGAGRGAPSDAVEPPVFRSTVTIVDVDVLVSDAQGNPVTDLTIDDFEVREDGRARPISAFASINLPADPPPAVPLDPGIQRDVVTNATPPGRTYLIALDEVAPDRALRARHMLRDFLEQHMGPYDVGAVALTGRGLASSGQDFTSDKRLLLSAIERFTGGFEGSTANGEADRAFSSDARQLASGLRQLTEFLATLPGRKVLLYVGEGLGGIDVFDVVDYRGGALTPASIDAHAAIVAATRGNVTIYPIDPRGLTTDLSPAESFDTSILSTRADLAAIAEVTGGFAVTGTNNLDTAFTRLVRENSVYYTIGFVSERARNDGRFVPVSVSVKRPGLQVRARAGYVAPLGQERRPERVSGDTRIAAVADALASPIATSDVPMRVFAAPYRASRSTASVAMAIEVDPAMLGLTLEGDTLTGQIEVSHLATDSRGKVRPGRRHNATLRITQDALKRSARDGVRVLSEIELPHGRYQLRVAAGSAARAGSVVYDLEVPDFGKGPLTMSGLSLTSVSAAQISTVRGRDPLGDALPGPLTANREFDATDTLAVFAEVYDNSSGRDKARTIELTTTLRAHDGTPVMTVPVRRETSEPRRKNGGHGFVTRLALQGLPAGTYTLHAEARADGAPDRTIARSVQLRVR